MISEVSGLKLHTHADILAYYRCADFSGIYTVCISYTVDLWIEHYLLELSVQRDANGFPSSKTKILHLLRNVENIMTESQNRR